MSGTRCWYTDHDDSQNMCYHFMNNCDRCRPTLADSGLVFHDRTVHEISQAPDRSGRVHPAPSRLDQWPPLRLWRSSDCPGELIY